MFFDINKFNKRSKERTFYIIILSLLIVVFIPIFSFAEELKTINQINVNQSDPLSVDLKFKANKAIKVNTTSNNQKVIIEIPQSELKGSIQELLALPNNSTNPQSPQLLKCTISGTSPQNPNSPTVYLELHFDRPINTQVVNNDTNTPSLLIKGNTVASITPKPVVKPTLTKTTPTVAPTIISKTPIPIPKKTLLTVRPSPKSLKTPVIFSATPAKKNIIPTIIPSSVKFSSIPIKSPTILKQSTPTPVKPATLPTALAVKPSLTPLPKISPKPVQTNPIKITLKNTASPTLNFTPKPSITPLQKKSPSPGISQNILLFPGTLKNSPTRSVISSPVKLTSSAISTPLKSLPPNNSLFALLSPGPYSSVSPSSLQPSASQTLLNSTSTPLTSIPFSASPSKEITKKILSFAPDLIFFAIILLLALIVFIGVYFMVSWLIRKFKQKKDSGLEKDSTTKTIDIISISDTKSIHIVESKNKLLLYEVQGNQTNLLTEITDPNLIATLKSKGGRKNSNFIAEYLKKIAINPSESSLSLTDKKIVSSSKVDFLINDEIPISSSPPELQQLAGPLPKIDPQQDLMSTLEKAMDKFAENNPDDDLISLSRKINITHTQPQSDPFKTLPVKTKIKKSEPPTQANESLKESLQNVIERQHRRLQLIREQKQQLKREYQRIDNAINKKDEIADRLNQIGRIISEINIETEEINEAPLFRSVSELQQLESDLIKLITDTSVIRRLIEEEEAGEYGAASLLRDFFDSIPKMFQEIKKYNKQIDIIKQRKELGEQERIRVSNLLTRQEELEEAIANLKNAIEQIEESNRELIQLDTHATPEQVPLVVINELKRLEFDLQSIMSDQGVRKRLSSF